MSFSESPLDADHQAVPTRRWLTPLVGVGLWLASVTVLTGALSGVLWSLRATGAPAQAELDAWQWGSRDKKLATLREAYSSRRPAITDPRREEIEKFLTEATKSDDSVGEGTWVGALDDVRFRRRVLDSPRGKSLSWFDRRHLAGIPISEFSVVSPNNVTSLKLLHIAPWAGGDETLVFTLIRQGYHEVEPVLFWLSHVDGHWKLVDWEFVDNGWSESESAAHWSAMSNDPLGSGYELAMWKLREADSLEYSQRDEYEKCLREVENYSIPGPAADYTRYLLMNRWSHRYHPQEVQRLAGLIQEPDRLPGVHMLRAVSFQRLNKKDEALSALDHVEQLVGFRPSLAESRARLFQQSKRRDEALAQWRLLADFDPGQQTYLSELYRLLPKSKRSEVLERIKSYSEPLKLAAEIVQSNRYQLGSDQMEDGFLKELAQLAKSIAPESAEARQIEIAQLESNDQYVEAAALSRKAAEQEPDKLKQQPHWNAYLIQMRKAGELLSGFAAHPDSKSAFQELVGGLEESESVIDVEELPALLAAYREKQPNDPWLHFYEGYYAAEKFRFADADKSFAEAERLLPPVKSGAGGFDSPGEDEEDDELANLRNQLRDQRCRARYELGYVVETLEAYNGHQSAYLTLAQIAVQYHHWKALTRLNQSFAVQQPRNLWLAYYEAKVLLGAKNFDAVRGKLRILRTRERETPGIDYYCDTLEFDLLLAEVADPVVAYGRSKDHESAFNRISHKLLAERDWDNLEKLCQKNRAGQNTPEVFFVRLEQAWRKRDYDRLVALLTPWPTEMFSQRSYVEDTWRDRRVRSLLRLNRWDEAHQFAQEHYQLHEDAWPLVMTYVARRNVEDIAKLLREDESFADTWKHTDFATDRELRPVLFDDVFAELRQQQLFALPDHRYGESLTLLYRAPLKLSETWLRERLSEPNAPAEIVVLSDDTAAVTWKGHRFMLMSSPMPYFPAEIVDTLIPASKRPLPLGDRYTVYLEQRAHLMLVALRDDDDDAWDSPLISVRQLGAKLLNADSVGAIHGQSIGWLKDLIPLTEASAEALASRRPFSEIGPQGFVIRAQHPVFQLSPEEKQSLKKLVEQRRNEPNQPPIRIDVVMVNDQIQMLERFQVIDIRRHRFGGHELIAEYAGSTPNDRFPELRPGLKFVIPIEQVYNFGQKSP